MAKKPSKATIESGRAKIAEGRRTLKVDCDEITDEEYLIFLDRLLAEWHSDADEKAFSRL
jgi:hypothetical protein